VPSGTPSDTSTSAAQLPASAAPPTGSPQPPTVSTSQAVPKVFIYPKTGQSGDQQARDRYECYQFGIAQTGFDPMRSGGSAPRAEQQADYERAQAACLEGRGYSVR
jgi:hypothetical protein